jgi:hypothetical protein
MKLADLPEVGEEQLPVVEDGLGRGGLVGRLHVPGHHLQHVASELLLRLDQLSNHRPGYTIVIISPTFSTVYFQVGIKN